MENQLNCISEVMEIDLTTDDLPRSLTEFEEWDSISALGLMAKADEDYDIALTPDQLEAAETIQDLVNLLEQPK